MVLESESRPATIQKEVRSGWFAFLFWLSLVLTIPTVYFSPMWQATLHFDALPLPFAGVIATISAFLVAGVSSPVLVAEGFREVKARKPGSSALLALAIIASYIFASIVQIFQWAGLGMTGQDFWWQAASLVTVALLGRWVTMRVELLARSPFPALYNVLPGQVMLWSESGPVQTPIAEIKAGDEVVAELGDLVAVDGVIVHGEAVVDEAFLKGANAVSLKKVGDFVFAGSLVSGRKADPSDLTIHDLLLQAEGDDGSLGIRVTATGADTLLGQIQTASRDAEQAGSYLQTLTRKTSYWIFFITSIGAAVTGLCWALFGDVPVAFTVERVIAVLAMGAPSLFLAAVPSVSRYAIANGAGHGVLIRSRKAFEELPKATHFLIDKTGILTTGTRKFADARITRRGGLESVDELLAVASGLEYGQKHGVAQAILTETYKRGIIPIGVKDVMNIPGVGISGRWEEHRLSIGGPVLLTRQKIDIDVQDLYLVDSLNTAGKTVVFVARDAILLGYIALDDEVSDTSAEVVRKLQRLKYRVALITGDAHGVAKAVAEDLGIKDFYAEVLPADKAITVSTLQDKGGVVALAGDAHSDEPALEKADISIAVALPQDFAVATADLVLLGSDAEPVAVLAELANHAEQKTRSNLFWAAGFNLVGLPLAAGILAPIGTVFVPAVCAGLSSVAMVIIWLNARSLERQS